MLPRAARVAGAVGGDQEPGSRAVFTGAWQRRRANRALKCMGKSQKPARWMMFREKKPKLRLFSCSQEKEARGLGCGLRGSHQALARAMRGQAVPGGLGTFSGQAGE